MTLRKAVDAIRAAMAAHPRGKPLNERNELVPDPVPVAPPVGYVKQPSMVEIVREQIRLAGLEAQRQGMESFDEANDFDIDDDPELQGEYELDDEPEVPLAVQVERLRQAQADRAAEATSSKALASLRSNPPGGGEGGGASPEKAPTSDPPGAQTPSK